MRVLRNPDEVAAANPDPLVRWAAQCVRPGRGGLAWAHGGAVGVLAPNLNRRDRLVLAGPVDGIAAILRARARPGVGPLVLAEVARDLPESPARATFGWMERTGALDVPDLPWLDQTAWDDVESLLRKASPNSYAWPYEPGPCRWTGIHDEDGTLVAVGADAWSAPGVGFLAGVATHPDHRGRGLSSRICAFLTSALLREHGTCALMVDGGNSAAIRVYERLGYAYRSVSVLRDAGHTD
ncbi:GNAT family N-acetyltransferase [Actinosynnema sp. NPDC047251]|uniref:N-acetyltransferase n=1 Tax=Saccharothrix espanaensis (strain ATCC 51144 / DSM 44229 / JCM 9112 / NBRC 15066 / NRRL 15764) TaxID=1179773 RepID=K0JST6_SACES|nr:GNAT family N-acetyltransferase [Saccharothrix espanaensis]CCH27914.1 N-acetyltransferase [Saccharothrix espanaensis DSM 44229]